MQPRPRAETCSPPRVRRGTVGNVDVMTAS
jgi:hypothetical protein